MDTFRRWWGTLNRVWAIGRETYLRLYPNPGLGLKLRGGMTRIALSWYGGFEVFRRQTHLVLVGTDDGTLEVTGRYTRVQSVDVWIRSYALLSRVQRPGWKGR